MLDHDVMEPHPPVAQSNARAVCWRRGHRWLHLERLGAAMIAVALLASALLPAPALARGVNALPMLERHRDMTREAAAELPQREEDQALVDGWPLYRTERGQDVFNTAMATLAATDRPSPSPSMFKGCEDLDCELALPRIGGSGWLPAGRLWLSPNEYIVVVRSPREGINRRRSPRAMRVFVFHEFRNGTRNTDVYDTISAHRRSVFVPFYISKPAVDVQGRTVVFLIQVAPYDVISRHAANHGNLGPGVEVANNSGSRMSETQIKAGVLLAEMVRAAAPRLRFVHHRNTEGLQMRRAFSARRAGLKRGSAGRRLTLPFDALDAAQLASVRFGLGDLIRRPGVKPSPASRDGVAIAARSPEVAIEAAIKADRGRRADAETPAGRRPRSVEAAADQTSSGGGPRPRLVSEPAQAPRLVAAPRIVSQDGGEPFLARQAPQSIGDLVRQILKN